MCVIDLTLIRRLKFEKNIPDQKLVCVDFDQYGFPKPLCEELEVEENKGEFSIQSIKHALDEDSISLIINANPAFARRLNLFPELRVVDDEKTE